MFPKSHQSNTLSNFQFLTLHYRRAVSTSPETVTSFPHSDSVFVCHYTIALRGRFWFMMWRTREMKGVEVIKLWFQCWDGMFASHSISMRDFMFLYDSSWTYYVMLLRIWYMLLKYEWIVALSPTENFDSRSDTFIPECKASVTILLEH